MEAVKRPTLLTVLAVLALIGGIFGILGGIALLALGIAALATGIGKASLVFGLLYLAISVLALIASITTLGNKKGCVDWMKKYAMASIGYNILWTIVVLIAGGAVSWGSTVIGLAIGGAILYFIMTNEGVTKYADSL